LLPSRRGCPDRARIIPKKHGSTIFLFWVISSVFFFLSRDISQVRNSLSQRSSPPLSCRMPHPIHSRVNRLGNTPFFNVPDGLPPLGDWQSFCGINLLTTDTLSFSRTLGHVSNLKSPAYVKIITDMLAMTLLPYLLGLSDPACPKELVLPRAPSSPLPTPNN